MSDENIIDGGGRRFFVLDVDGYRPHQKSFFRAAICDDTVKISVKPRLGKSLLIGDWEVQQPISHLSREPRIPQITDILTMAPRPEIPQAVGADTPGRADMVVLQQIKGSWTPVKDVLEVEQGPRGWVRKNMRDEKGLPVSNKHGEWMSEMVMGEFKVEYKAVEPAPAEDDYSYGYMGYRGYLGP